MYDREKCWHILFLQAPKAPEGCVLDPKTFGQPCPTGTYKDLQGQQHTRLFWIYPTMEPRSTDVGRKAPAPKPEDLPLLKKILRTAPSDHDNSDSDDNDYPDMDNPSNLIMTQ